MPCGCGPEKACGTKPLKERDAPLDEDLVEGESEEDAPTDECRHCNAEIHADAALCPVCNKHDPIRGPHNSPAPKSFGVYLLCVGLFVILAYYITVAW